MFVPNHWNKRNVKKSVSCLLIVVMLLSMLPAGVIAATEGVSPPVPVTGVTVTPETEVGDTEIAPGTGAEEKRLFPRWLDREGLSPEQPAVGEFGVQATGIGAIGTITGAVTSVDGSPVALAYVDLWDAGTGTYKWVQTDALGIYTISVPLGTYEMWVYPTQGEYLARAYFPAITITEGQIAE